MAMQALLNDGDEVLGAGSRLPPMDRGGEPQWRHGCTLPLRRAG